MLPKELIDKLPSMDDLLEHPQVRSATEKLSSSTIATRAREAFAHLTKEVSRQADGWRDTSSGELIDRLVGFMRQPEIASQKKVINATGKLHGNEGRFALPMADVVKKAILHQASQFTDASLLTDEVYSRLKDLTSAKQAVIANSYITAHTSIFKGFKEIVIARVDVGNLDSETRILELAQACGLVIKEAGTASEVTVDEMVSLDSECEAAKKLIYLGPEAIRSFVNQNIELGDAFKELKKSGVRLVVAIADSALIELPGAMGVSRLSMQSAITFGADIVIARGDGLVGGPSLGLLVGETDLISECSENLKQNRQMPNRFGMLALCETLSLFQNVEQLPFMHPILGLVDTPLENLKLRAERLATLLSDSEQVTHIELQEIDQPCFAEGIESTKSWGLKVIGECISSKDFSFEECQIVGNPMEGACLLDLRTVFPSEDQVIVDQFCGKNLE